MRKSKYGNSKVQTSDGTFDSRKEFKRWGELKMLEKAGEITELYRQVPFLLFVNGKLICKYLADYTYKVGEKFVVEDCKGMKTPVYNLKKKLMMAINNIEIKET